MNVFFMFYEIKRENRKISYERRVTLVKCGHASVLVILCPPLCSSLFVLRCLLLLKVLFQSAMPRKTRNAEYDEAELSEDGKLIVMILEQKMDAIVTKLTDEIGKRDERIDQLEQEVNRLKVNMRRMEDSLDEADAYERRDTLILSGKDIPPAVVGEVPSEVACDIVKHRLKINIKSTDLSTAHRLGPKPKTQGPDRRNIIIKLCRRELKHDLITACKKYKPPNIFINESLTPTRNSIFFTLRQAKKKYPNKIAACSTHDGKVYAWIKPPNTNEK